MNTLLVESLHADVAEFLDTYILHERRLADNTHQTYARSLRWFTRFVGDGGVADYLAPQACEVAAFVESLHDAGLAPATRAITITALRLFYGRLVDVGRLSASAARPVEALAVPSIPERLPRVLTVEEVRRLLEAPDRTAPLYLRDRALLEFLYASACRASEAADLRLDNLDLDAGTARVKGKGSKERLVLLGEPAVQALQAYLHLLRPELAERASEAPAWVFLSQSGLRLTRELIWSLVNGYAAVAGVPEWVGVHSLRHAAATHFLQGGADVRFAQEYLGHANVRTTQVYLNLDLSDLRRVHELFMAYRLTEEVEAASAETAEPTAAEKSAAWVPIHRNSFGPWTPEEDELLRSFAEVEAAARLPWRTHCAVRLRRKRLGIKRMVRPRKEAPPWTPEEDELLRTLPVEEAVQHVPGRSLSAILCRRKELGLARQSSHLQWTAEEEMLVRTLPAREVAERTGHTLSAVQQHRRKLGMIVRRDWTAEEDDLARTLPAPEVAERTGRTFIAVRLRQQLLQRRSRTVPGGTPPLGGRAASLSPDAAGVNQ